MFLRSSKCALGQEHTFFSHSSVCYATSSSVALCSVGPLSIVSDKFLTHPSVGGAATVTAITGMPVESACFLLPIGIAVYVVVGGLRATFICDWAHTVILFIIIYIFIFKT